MIRKLILAVVVTAPLTAQQPAKPDSTQQRESVSDARRLVTEAELHAD